MTRHAYPPTGPILRVNGHPVHAHIEGPPAGQAPDVILIHGASGNTRDWTFDLIGRLVPRFRVIAFDRPGLGHTPRLHDEGETPAEQAALLNAASDALGVRSAILVGHSYGGSVAMAWALDHPERVAAVVSLAGATMPWQGGLGPWYGIASSALGAATIVPIVSAFAPRVLTGQAIRSIFQPQDVPAGYTDHIGLPLTMAPAALRTNARQVNTLKPHVTAMAARYPNLSIPVEILHGDLDTIVPLEVHSRPMAALLKDAGLTVLGGVGHMPHHADPDAAVAAIERAAARAALR